MYRPLSSGPIQYKSTHHPSAAQPERPKNHSSGEEKDRINYWSCLLAFCAPVAQLDRALASEARGRVFESRRAHHLILKYQLVGESFREIATGASARR